jgi:hypothetical protein
MKCHSSQNAKKKHQLGQSLIEFMLLLMVISLMSVGFIKFSNKYLGEYWVYFVNTIIDDPAVKVNLP